MEMVEEEDVGFIRLQFTDIFGTFKNVAVTASQLKRALDNQCMFDGSSIEGFARVEDSDMYLYPDLNTFATFPWRPQQGKVARLICDVHKADGTVLESDPRHVLKWVLQEAKEMGYTFDVGRSANFSCSIRMSIIRRRSRPTMTAVILTLLRSIWAVLPGAISVLRSKRWALRSKPLITNVRQGSMKSILSMGML